MIDLQQICQSDYTVRSCVKELGQAVVKLFRDMFKLEQAYFKQLQAVFKDCTKLYMQIFSARELKKLEAAIEGLPDKSVLEASFDLQSVLPAPLRDRICKVLPARPQGQPLSLE